MNRTARIGSLMTLIWVIGCSGDGSDPLAPAGGAKHVWATVDGELFISDTVFADLVGDHLQVIVWRGSDVLRIVSQEIAGAGTYAMSADPSAATYASVSIEGRYHFTTGWGPPSDGTLTLTTVSPNRVIGTFSFVGVDYSWDAPWTTGETVTVQNGVLDLTLP